MQAVNRLVETICYGPVASIQIHKIILSGWFLSMWIVASVIKITLILFLGICMSELTYGNDIVISSEIQAQAKQTFQKQVQMDEDLQSKLDQINQYVHSQAWESQQVAYQTKVLQMLDQSIEPSNDSGQSSNNINARPVLFISESIPLPTLRRYARDLSKINGVMVLRGAIDGLKHLEPTMKLSADILKRDLSCEQNCPMQNTTILIDPILFRQNDIEAVPALIVTDEIDFMNHCEDANNHHQKHDRVYGDASIQGLLEELHLLNNDLNVKALAKELL